jgi:shikimate dehydrogenase
LNCQVSIINRTLSNAQVLVEAFNHLGNIHLHRKSSTSFDLIINTMPQDGQSWLQHYSINQLENTHIYDISYGTRAAGFLQWCQEQNCLSSSDGWGMLVEQAALSFAIWHGTRPVTEALHLSCPGRDL